MGVSKNRGGPPKSSIIFGNTHICFVVFVFLEGGGVGDRYSRCHSVKQPCPHFAKGCQREPVESVSTYERLKQPFLLSPKRKSLAEKKAVHS